MSKNNKQVDDDAKNKEGQVNKILQDLESILDEDEYFEACDSAGTLIAYIRLSAKRQKI